MYTSLFHSHYGYGFHSPESGTSLPWAELSKCYTWSNLSGHALLLTGSLQLETQEGGHDLSTAIVSFPACCEPFLVAIHQPTNYGALLS
jgi:hypothetical protein